MGHLKTPTNCVLFISRGLQCKFPLHSRRKTGATPPAQTCRLNFGADRRRFQIQGPGKSAVAAAHDVFIDNLRIN